MPVDPIFGKATGLNARFRGTLLRFLDTLLAKLINVSIVTS